MIRKLYQKRVDRWRRVLATPEGQKKYARIEALSEFAFTGFLLAVLAAVFYALVWG